LLRRCHQVFLLRSAWLYRFRCRPAEVSPGAFTPAIDAATAQPTRQSSQWLSAYEAAAPGAPGLQSIPLLDNRPCEPKEKGFVKLWLHKASYLFAAPRESAGASRVLVV
jgi:hypothetical protein